MVNAEAAVASTTTTNTTMMADPSTQDTVATTSSSSSQSQAVLRVNMTSRFIGLVVLPGEHIVKIEVEG